MELGEVLTVDPVSGGGFSTRFSTRWRQPRAAARPF